MRYHVSADFGSKEQHMVFRYYSNAVSRASRTIATSVFIVGLLLIGFAFLIYLLPDLFGYLMAIVFFIAGVGCAITAIKMFIAAQKLDDMEQDDAVAYRRNVRIKTDDHFDD
jgi:hypothetical protein